MRRLSSVGLVSLSRPRLRLSAAVALFLAGAAFLILWPARSADLVIYAGGERAAGVAAAFAQTNGIAVTVVRLFTGPLLARIAAEGHRPRWSLAWFDGDMPAAALDRAGLLAHGVTLDLPWTLWGSALRPANGAWTPVGLTLAGVDIRLKQSISGGVALGIADPAMSGQAYPQLAGLLSTAGGWPEGRKHLEEMRAAGLIVAQTSANVVMLLFSHRIREASLQSSTAYALATRDPSIAVTVPRPAFLLPNVMVIAADATPAQRRRAERFIAFALSQPVQKARLEGGGVESFYWPVVKGPLLPPAIMPDLATLDVLHPDASKWGLLQARVTDWFETNVARR